MHAFHGLPFVAAMGMMDALVGTAAAPGLDLAGKGGYSVAERHCVRRARV